MTEVVPSKTEVTRYDMEWDRSLDRDVMIADEEGEWVRFEDVQNEADALYTEVGLLRREVERLRIENEALRQGVALRTAEAIGNVAECLSRAAIAPESRDG